MCCKKCKKAFRKDLSLFEESDEFCPHCDNHFVIDAETKETKAIREGKAQMVVGLEMEAGEIYCHILLLSDIYHDAHRY